MYAFQSYQELFEFVIAHCRSNNTWLPALKPRRWVVSLFSSHYMDGSIHNKELTKSYKWKTTYKRPTSVSVGWKPNGSRRVVFLGVSLSFFYRILQFEVWSNKSTAGKKTVLLVKLSFHTVNTGPVHKPGYSERRPEIHTKYHGFVHINLSFSLLSSCIL